jgi:hypothetical protein
MMKPNKPVSQRIQEFGTQLIKLDKAPTPWPRMFVSAVASTLPLMIGYANEHLGVSVYGALTGYLLALNDHLGTFKQRLQIVTLTFLFLLCGFSIGFWAHTNAVAFYIFVPLLIYGIGVLGGEGAEAERAVLFLVISIIVSYFSKPLPESVQFLLLEYALIAFVTVMLAIPILMRIKALEPEMISGLRENLKKSLNRKLEKHIHAISYVCAALFAIWLAFHFQFERGYWIVITVLLVMRADRTQSLYISSQRLVGTALGVLAFDLFLLTHPPAAVLIAWVMVCTFLVPLSLKRNYLIASFFITSFVVTLLELATIHQGTLDIDMTTPFLRLQATFIGCVIGVMGTAFSKTLASALSLWRPPPSGRSS